MGGIGSGKSPAMRDYWSRMTPEQRSAEMQRRMRIGKRRKNREIASSESPFLPDTQVTQVYLKPKRNLKGLIADLEAITSDLKALFGD